MKCNLIPTVGFSFQREAVYEGGKSRYEAKLIIHCL